MPSRRQEDAWDVCPLEEAPQVGCAESTRALRGASRQCPSMEPTQASGQIFIPRCPHEAVERVPTPPSGGEKAAGAADETVSDAEPARHRENSPRAWPSPGAATWAARVTLHFLGDH